MLIRILTLRYYGNIHMREKLVCFFDNIYACGYCPPSSFSCEFCNGKEFACYSRSLEINQDLIMRDESTKVNSNVKDTVFRLLFKEKEPLLEIYNAMNDSDYDNPDDLIITTLEASIFVGMKNDLSYIFNDQLFLYEHQSTVNPNMPLRDFLYLSSLYSKLVKDEHIYSTRLIKIPEPKFIVFYNGTKEMPKYCQMKLSDCFEKTSENPDLELTVHHYNINIGYNKAEVIMLGVYEYDEEKHMRIVARDAKAEGLEEGLEDGSVICRFSLKLYCKS